MQKYFVKFCSTFSLQSFFFFENYPLQAYRVSKTYICIHVKKNTFKSLCPNTALCHALCPLTAMGGGGQYLSGRVR